MKTTLPTEDEECEFFHRWLELKGIKHHHSANESQSGRRDAVIRNARNKRLGQSKGFLDYLIIIPANNPKDEETPIRKVMLLPTIDLGTGKYYMRTFSNRLVAIEMKRKKGGKVSPEQKEWINALNSAGIETAVCKGADEAIKFIEERIK